MSHDRLEEEEEGEEEITLLHISNLPPPPEGETFTALGFERQEAVNGSNI